MKNLLDICAGLFIFISLIVTIIIINTTNEKCYKPAKYIQGSIVIIKINNQDGIVIDNYCSGDIQRYMIRLSDNNTNFFREFELKEKL